MFEIKVSKNFKFLFYFEEVSGYVCELCFFFICFVFYFVNYFCYYFGFFFEVVVLWVCEVFVVFYVVGIV